MSLVTLRSDLSRCAAWLFGRRGVRTRESERAAFGVPADRPVLARVNDAPSKLDETLERVREIGDAEVGQREPIARATATLVQPERRLRPPGLEALPFALIPLLERDVEQRLPEVSGAGEVVSGELDQIEWHARNRFGFASHR